jgi:Transcription factor DP
MAINCISTCNILIHYCILYKCCRDTYVFNFNDRFEMHDDVEVLKRSGLAVGLESGKCHGVDLERALKLVDINLRPYIIG